MNNFPATQRDPRPTSGPTPGLGSGVPMVLLPELRARAGELFTNYSFQERERQRYRARYCLQKMLRFSDIERALSNEKEMVLNGIWMIFIEFGIKGSIWMNF